MTTHAAADKFVTPQPPEQTGVPGVPFIKNLSIGARLLFGFGLLVALTLLVGAFSYLASTQATINIDRTGEVRVPTALASSQAQVDLLRMLGDVRGYLALGESEFRESYEQARQDFEVDLFELERLSPQFNEESKQSILELRATYNELSQLPEELFELRDDRLEREEAYRILATDGSRFAGSVLIDTQGLIEAQARSEPTRENLELMEDMADFQGSFAAMLSGLRGYVTTQNRIFRGEYEANYDLNEIAWQRLQRNRSLMTPSQQERLDQIADNRDQFLELPAQMFEILESDQYRKDLYLFTTEVVPLTEKMQRLLAELTLDQQTRLQRELDIGRVGLATANRRILFSGIAALILGAVLALVFRENIAGPIRRLTGVAEQIRAGDLDAQARIESKDEIGTLAMTFNNMTGQLRQTLRQVRKEKKRADDLLDVVIPIGVELTSEKNFNRLLEKMLIEAKAFCHADAGILYLLREEDKALEYVIANNDTLNLSLGGTTGKKVQAEPLPLYDAAGVPNDETIVTHVALSGESLNIADARQPDAPAYAGPEVFGPHGEYEAISYLTIPLKNSEDKVVGVMQLINAKDLETRQVVPFDYNLQQMMESFSSLAVAALEAYVREESLKQEIQQLRIEIDQAKRQQEVSKIVETEVFQDLKARARELRRRNRSRRADSTE